MSPLVALAALAAAALLSLLAGAHAVITIADEDNALSSSYDGVCTTQVRGYKSKSTITLPTILIPAQQREYSLDIPDKCPEQGKLLVGGVVTACDSDLPPLMSLAPMAAGPGGLRRRGRLQNTAHCYVKLYCI